MAFNCLKHIYINICLCFIYCSSSYSDEYQCQEETLCHCKLANNSFLDISSVVTKDQPFLSNMYRNLTYYYAPCQDFKFDYKALNIIVNDTLDECKLGSSLCLYNATDKSLKNLSTARNFKFSGGYPKSLVSLPNTWNITSLILLVCTPFASQSFLMFNEYSADQPQLQLFSPQACLRYESSGLSTGTKLLLVTLVLFGTYLLGGTVSLHCLRGARGKEMIPNIDFWTDLPCLVKDGVIFLGSGCNPLAVTTADTYDRI